MVNAEKLKSFLDHRVYVYESPEFIVQDPVSIPHRFTKKQDREIAGFFAATLAWGQRKTIIRNCLQLMKWMEEAPHDFLVNHQEADRKRFLGFVHRTFNDTDLLYFIEFLQWFYQKHESLEDAFLNDKGKFNSIEESLTRFHLLFFSLPDAPQRTQKHVASPAKKSACKRLNMYLRWMVRSSQNGVDFGIWKRIPVSELICPLDTHVHRVALGLGMIQRKQSDWLTAVELTNFLKTFDPEDPVKYDYALFSLGENEGF
ncbi:MAG: TIGR02757 family protein [Bacteroidota bacterium]|nr:TIGR02757 family protein [Bacteroidota bacterium]MDX5430060.1 TIGR02757 family protein [Bacteroidota bacterium]MDX5468830.1 TIGR02757 family protein [Bacteroidota bacterium]